MNNGIRITPPNPDIGVLILCVLWLSLLGIPLLFSVGMLAKLRPRKLRRLFLFSACSLMGGMVIYLSDWANIVPTFLLFLAAVWISCEGSMMKRLTVGLMLASTVFSFNVLMDNGTVLHGIKLPLVRLFFCMGLCFFIRRYGPEREFELSPSMWRLLFLLTLPPVGIVFSLVLFSDPHSSRLSFQYLVLLLLALFSFGGLLWTMVVLARQQKLEKEALLAAQNVHYYKAMEQQHFEIRRLKHDMANHLQTALALSPEQRAAYLQELLENPGVAHTLKYCGDNTVNVILSIKEAAMKQKGIAFHVLADIPQPLPLEKPDISGIFGNALDNAIEAVLELPPEKRRISLEARCARGLLAVSIRNPGRLPEDCGAHFPGTTKGDRAAHGLGLPSIREALRKYGGTLELRQEGEEVCLFIVTVHSQA